MYHFRAQKGPLAQRDQNFFWYKPVLLLSSTYWPFSMCKILKNSYSGSRVMRCAILGAKMVHLLQTFFFLKIINIILIYLLNPFIEQNFKKPVNEPFFFHSCLFTCQKSKSDINLLVKYLRLKNSEISSAECHF